jgi:hypothetical protein
LHLELNIAGKEEFSTESMKLKKVLKVVLILPIFEVPCDASNMSLDAALSQEGNSNVIGQV